MPSIHFIYASTSGHTEYVIAVVAQYLHDHAPHINVEVQRAELAHAEDLLRGDMIILGSGTWNTGGVEGQLNMYMEELLRDRAKEINFEGKAVSCISLGDDRYYFRTRCTEHFLRFIRDHKGALAVPPIVLVNEPYGQEEKIVKWAEKIMQHVSGEQASPTDK